MTDLLHVWAYCDSKTFHSIVYQPNGSWYKLYRPEQSASFKSLWGYFWYIYSNMAADALEYDFHDDIGPCMRGEIDSLKWK